MGASLQASRSMDDVDDPNHEKGGAKKRMKRVGLEEATREVRQKLRMDGRLDACGLGCGTKR